MKICWAMDNYYPPRLAYTETYYFTKYLADFGVDVTVLCGKENNSDKKIEVIDKVKVIRTPFNYIYGRRIHTILFSFFVLKYFLNNHQDFGLIIVRYIYTSFLIHIILKLKGVKSTIVSQIEGIPLKRKISGLLLRELAVRTADYVLFGNELIAYKITNKRKSNKFFFVSWGVNAQIFSPPTLKDKQMIRKKLGFKIDDIILISIGTLSPTRELENIIIGFKDLLYQLRNQNIKLIIIGDGPDYNHLVNLAEKYNLTNKAIFLGYLPHKKIPMYLKAADIGICYLPISLYDVQPSLKVLEYLACSLPTIATNTYGNRMYIKNNCNGLIINDSHYDLTLAMNKLIENKELRQYMSANSRLDRQKYDWYFIVKNYLLPQCRKMGKSSKNKMQNK